MDIPMDMPERPKGNPKTLGPKTLEPLFDSEQIRQVEEIEKKSGIITPLKNGSIAEKGVGKDWNTHQARPVRLLSIRFIAKDTLSRVGGRNK